MSLRNYREISYYCSKFKVSSSCLLYISIHLLYMIGNKVNMVMYFDVYFSFICDAQLRLEVKIEFVQDQIIFQYNQCN